MAQVDGLFSDSLPARPRRDVPRATDSAHTPVLAEYVRRTMTLHGRHKGQRLKATVRRNGTIRYAGKLFTSPSLAGAAAVKRESCNGWTFWEYERAPGDWVKLDHLRK